MGSDHFHSQKMRELVVTFCDFSAAHFTFEGKERVRFFLRFSYFIADPTTVLFITQLCS
jgi:hypothetical protein